MWSASTEGTNMSWMLHHTYIKWGWQCSNCKIIKRMRFLSVPFIVLRFSFHVPSLWFQKYFYFLVLAFLSCTLHFLSRLFHLPFTFMPCHFIENISNFCACSCQIMFIVLGSFHDLPCPFMLFPVLYFFQRSSILLYSLLYLNAFHFLPLSFHVRFFPCPSILCSYPFIVPSCHAQNLTDRLFGMRDRGHRGGHTL